MDATRRGLWLAAALITAIPAHAGCKMVRIADMPVTIIGNRAFLDAEINGEKVKALIDTGAQASTVWRSEAIRLHLPLVDASEVKIYGVGGQAQVQRTVIDHLVLAGVTASKVRFLVVGSQRMGPGNGSLLLGEDIWSRFTVEFDFGHEIMRLFRTQGCKDEPLVYWATSYSSTMLDDRPANSNAIKALVALNGRNVLAQLDSGAGYSVVTNEAAANAGLFPDSNGVLAQGPVHGVGAHVLPSWTGMFAKFEIGDEKIFNAQLHIADMFRDATRKEIGSNIAVGVTDTQMLLGADFFRAHRIIVPANGKSLGFTFNGGLVFRLPQPGEAINDRGTSQDSAPAAEPSPPAASEASTR
jgi:hypothetical protein